jgi:pimeloyl-ACP methyl ester carboxylesterase
MYFFFPGNYMWSQGTLRVLYTGGTIGEVARIIPSLQEAAVSGDVDAWHRAWTGLGDHLWQQGEWELAQERPRSAGRSFYRACSYYQWAIGYLPHTDPRKREGHQRSVEAFTRFAEHSQRGIERVEVPYEGGSLPAWFIPGSDGVALPAAGTEARATVGQRKPSACFLPGLESTKEQAAEFGLELAERGFNVLLVDGPGVGESVLFRGLVNHYDEEVSGRADLEYLLSRPEVDPQRVALVGLSLGGYRAARVVAFEPRYAACVLWGAIWDWGKIWQGQLARTRAASTDTTHFLHVFGGESIEDVTRILQQWRLEGVAERIRCPILVMHGEQDSQIPVEDAYQVYRACGSPQKELKVFTEQEGGAAHCQNDNRLLAHAYIADYLEDVLVRGRRREGVIVGWERKA